MVALEELLDLLPPDLLERVACRYGLDAARSVKLSGPVVFVCLLNALLNHPDLSQRLLEETYRQQTGQTCDHSSWGKCLARIEPRYFADLFAALHSRLAGEATPGEARALRIRRVDATTVTLSAKLLAFGLAVGTRSPDKPRRHLKSVVELDEAGLPNLLRLCARQSEAADSVALGEAMAEAARAGDLWVFDAGCHGRARLLTLHTAGAFFLTPHTQQGVRVTGVLFQADAPPAAPPAEGGPGFVVARVEQAVFENGQQPAQNKKWEAMPLVLIHGLRWDGRGRTWKPLALMTNLPLSGDGQRAGPFSWAELAEVYRSRWDIEVFFKFAKQHLSYAHLVSRCENGIRVMLYMGLLAALLLIWYKRRTGIDRGWRSVKFWLAEDARLWAQQLLYSTQLAPDG